MTLERTANILIVATALVAIPTLGLQLYERATVRPVEASPRYARGDSLQPAVNIDAGHARRALVLYLNSSCRYCTESMDFYKRIREWREHNAEAATIVVLGQESESRLLDYTLAHGFKPDRVISVRGTSFKLSGTPSLLLVSRTGIVEEAWYGRLSPAQEQAVLERLKTV
jgi:hypothetical protein